MIKIKNKIGANGMVLVLAVIIIGTVLSSAAVLGNLIIREIQQSRLIDQSMQAYLSAESGAERSLYLLRRREAVKPQDCGQITGGSCQSDDAFCSLSSGQVACIAADAGSLAVRTSWNVEVNNENKISVYLGTGGSFQVDLFNPYQTGQYEAGVQSFLVESDIVNGTTIYGEITNFSQLLGGTANCPLSFFTPPQPPIGKGRVTLIQPTPQSNYSSSGYLKTFSEDSAPELNPYCSYVLRLSNILLPQAQPGVFILSLYKKGDNIDPLIDFLPIPSRLIIDSAATFGKSYQKIRVSTPVRPPLSGLYDFVIFSEETIVK